MGLRLLFESCALFINLGQLRPDRVRLAESVVGFHSNTVQYSSNIVVHLQYLTLILGQ